MQQQANGSITLYPVTYSKEKLAGVPEDECVVHFTLAQMANEIFMLHRATLVYLQGPDDELNPIASARTATALTFAQILAGKLYEACVFLTRNPTHSKLVPTYAEGMPSEAKDALDQIKRFVDKDTLIKHIRRKVAFHYDEEQMRAAYRNFPEADKLVEYFSEAEANSFYGGASLISTFAAIRASRKEDLKPRLDDLMDDVLEVSRWVKDYVHGFMEVFLVRNVESDLATMMQKDAIILTGLPRLVDVHAPYFCETTPPTEK